MADTTNLLALFTSLPSWAELLVIAFVGLLLFGRRLPEVARSLGQSIVEFKKGMQGVKHDMDNASSQALETEAERRRRLSLPDAPPSTPTTTSPASAKQGVESHD